MYAVSSIVRKDGRPVSARAGLQGLPVASCAPITYCLPACNSNGVGSVATGDPGVTFAEARRLPDAASQMPIRFPAVDPEAYARPTLTRYCAGLTWKTAPRTKLGDVPE